jgi:hypothetical protein
MRAVPVRQGGTHDKFPIGNFPPRAFAPGLRYRYPYAVLSSQKAELLRG